VSPAADVFITGDIVKELLEGVREEYVEDD